MKNAHIRRDGLIIWKDFEDNEEIKHLVPIIQTLNKILESIVVYRSHKHRETFWSAKSMNIEKKWLKLDFALVTTSASRSKGELPMIVKAETDPEKIKKQLEQDTINYLIWAKEYKKKEEQEKKE